MTELYVSYIYIYIYIYMCILLIVCYVESVKTQDELVTPLDIFKHCLLDQIRYVRQCTI